jgi:leucine dehydrogenase
MQTKIMDYMAKYNFRKLVFCNNNDVGLRAIIAIHSTDLGPACGGLRMWTYESEDMAIMDALRLGRGMTYKYAAAGVNLGGGKAVIIGDPRTQKTEGLLRAMGRFIESLHGEYRTGEDVGTTLDDDASRLTETDYVITLPEYCGGAGNGIGPATAFGVQQAMKACAREVWGPDSLQGKTVALQGLGRWARAGAGRARQGGSSRHRGRHRPGEGRPGAEGVRGAGGGAGAVHALDCDVYAPYAPGGTLDDRTLPALRCRIVCGSANNQRPKNGTAPVCTRWASSTRPTLHRERRRSSTPIALTRGFNRERARASVAHRRANGGAHRDLRSGRPFPWVAADRLAERRQAGAPAQDDLIDERYAGGRHPHAGLRNPTCRDARRATRRFHSR